MPHTTLARSDRIPATSTHHPVPTDLRERFRAIVDAMAGGDLDALDCLVRFDIVVHNRVPAQGDGRPGLAFWAHGMRTAIPDLVATIEDTVVEDHTLAARVSFSGTHSGDHLGLAASDAFVEFEYFVIVRFTEGLAVEWWDASNTVDALRNIGAHLNLPSGTATS
ncbi:ester cyclase [Rhodococcus opacus]|uniref:ester cyclase n=1 Tax=Rhodococcus opacus TaxID=37919 RepID=UPI002235FAC5|nr:ester cyclase [Rhodococcus opacus]UZG59838.1 ester cyclase [Rhodococcus opacus]